MTAGQKTDSQSLPQGFRDVDKTVPEKFIRCLDTLQNMKAGRAYKERALEFLDLRPDSAALDIACGLGNDVVRMKPRCRRAVGVDRSATFITHAKSRHDSSCEFFQASADNLPFPDASFDAVRIDRSLQHIPDPGQVVREMARVAKPGGVVLCAEPDWGTFLLGTPHSEITAAIAREWIGSFQNPWIGRSLSSLLTTAGVVDIRWEGIWLPTVGFEESDLLFEVDATARKVAKDLPATLDWLDSYKKSESYGGVLMLICYGHKS